MSILTRLLGNENKGIGVTGDQRAVNWWESAMVIGGSSSGVAVTPDSALTNAAVFACVRILSETLASLPLITYERKGRARQRATEFYLYPLLHDEPNEWMTSFEYRETLQGHLALWGNAFSEITYDGAGRVTSLFPLRPDKMKGIKLEGGRRLYKYELPNHTEIWLDGERIWHLRAFGDGTWGYSPIQLMRNAVGLALAMEKFGSKFFGNGARPGGVLEHPGRLGGEAQGRLRESWNEMHSGLDNAHKVAILEEGMKWHEIGMPLEDAQFLEGRKFQGTEIARMYRVPPHMIADLDKATFCLPADTEIFTAGGPTRIADVAVGDAVWSWDGEKYLSSRVLRTVCTGEDEILELHTSNRVLRANARHRILVRRKFADPQPGVGGYQHIVWKNVYVPAGELQVGDTLVTLERLPDGSLDEINGRKLTMGFMEFCGLLLGDGNVNKSQGVTIARSENALYMDHYRQVMSEEFVSFGSGGNGRQREGVPTYPVKIREGDRQTRFSSVLAAEELTALGLSGTAHTKSVPAWVFETSHEMKLAFLRGFLDADGSVDKLGRISMNSVNQHMLSQIRHLCMAVGVPVTNLRRQVVNSVLPTGAHFSGLAYAFTCSDPGANRLIWSHDTLYQERLSSGRPFGRKARAYPRHGGDGFGSEGCGLSRINKIRRLPAEPVYDLEVESTHSFIADGVVVHNSNIEQQDLEFLVHTMRPWFVRWEQSINKHLMMDEERRRFYVEFLVDALMRGDTASRTNYYATGKQWGWLSTNDIREKENMNPVDGGDQYLTPMNMMVVGESSSRRAAPVVREARQLPAGSLEERTQRSVNGRRRIMLAHQAVMEELMRRLYRREINDVRPIARRMLPAGMSAEFSAWLAKFYQDHRKWTAEQALKTFRAYMEMIAGEAEEETGRPLEAERLEGFVNSYTESFSDRQAAYSEERIRALLENEDALEAMEEEFSNWQDVRPGRAAGNEVVQQSNAISKLVYLAAGIQLIRWVSSGESCPYCDSLDGMKIGINQLFLVKGESWNPEGAESALVPSVDIGHPPAHEGCDCMIAAG